MGRQVDLDKPLSAEDKQYLISRGRSYLIPANERRFGSDGKAKPQPYEQAGAPAQSPSYDPEVYVPSAYDAGGAPLPNTVRDNDTRRVADRQAGVLIEYTGPGDKDRIYEQEGFESYGEDGEIDDDIVQEVTSIKTVKDLKTRLRKEKVEFDSDAKREELEDLLAIALQDKRDAEKQSE